MGKKTSRAEIILQEALRRVETAEANVRDHEARLNVAHAALNAHQQAYDALVEALAPTPRKSPKSPPAQSVAQRSPRGKKTTDAPQASTETEKATVSPVGVCAVPNCGQAEDGVIHDLYGGEYGHVFQAVKTKGATGG